MLFILSRMQSGLGGPPESSQSLPSSPSPTNRVENGSPLFTPVHYVHVCPVLPQYTIPTFSRFPDLQTQWGEVILVTGIFLSVCFHKKCLQSLQYQFQCFTNVSRNLSCNQIRMLLQKEVSSLCQIQMVFSYLEFVIRSV